MKLPREKHQVMRKAQRDLFQFLWKLRVSKHLLMMVSSGPKPIEVSWDIMDRAKKGNYELT